MSRRQTPRHKREKTRSRRSIDRAIVRAVCALEVEGTIRHVIKPDNSAEIIGLCLARRRL